MPCTRTGLPLRFIPAGDGHVRRQLDFNGPAAGLSASNR